MLFMLNSFPMTPLFEISAVSCAIIVLQLTLTNPPLFCPPYFWRVLQNTGKLSLSIYILHIFFFLGIERMMKQWAGTGLYPGLATSVVLALLIVTPALADNYARHFDKGPFEWLLRRTAAKLW